MTSIEKLEERVKDDLLRVQRLNYELACAQSEYAAALDALKRGLDG
ncbi:hypothetical protein [Nocardia sp. NPDC057455]